MNLKVKRFDKELPLPVYQTFGSVAVDLYSRVDMRVLPHELGLIPANIVVKVPPGFMFVVSLRSGIPKKKSLLMPHGVGIIDQDYCGDEDEVKIQVFNFSDSDSEIGRGERIAQGMLVPVSQIRWKEVQVMRKPNRGGFGSTGIQTGGNENA